MHWRRKWQPTPVFLPGESQGWGSFVDCRLWGRTESDTIAPSPGREAALAWASLAQRFPASSVLAREGAGCGSVGDVTGAWLASAPLSPSLWT